MIRLVDWLEDHTPELVYGFFGLFLIMMIAIVCYVVWLFGAIASKDPVQAVPQSQIETPVGVKAAAGNAGYDLSGNQSKQIAHSVKEIYENSSEPDYTVYTDSNSINQDSEKARQDNKADFALITDPSDPNKRVDLTKLGESTPVTLYQYNIKAYPKVIRQVSYGKNVTTGADVAGAAINWRISKSGKYLGVGVEQSFSADRATTVKLIYSF